MFGLCGESWEYRPTVSGFGGVASGFVVSCGRILPFSSGGYGFVAGIFRKNDPILTHLYVAVGG
jgi:hypothetical protein